MTERTLDWRPNPDPRNELFRFAGLTCFQQGKTYINVRRKKKVFLDQGQEGACTGFGFEHVRALSPYPQLVSVHSARDAYIGARYFDEWWGEDYEGSSVNGVMKWGRSVGTIKSWYWCKTLVELDHALSWHGAVEGGSNWYTGMFSPDSNGVLHASGNVEGGHAYAIAGKRLHPTFGKQYRIDNSWGEDWGELGGAWISDVDMQKLMDEDGEFACPVKVRF